MVPACRWLEPEVKIDHHDFDVAADEIVQRGGGALVGNVGELHAGLAGKALHGQVMR